MNELNITHTVSSAYHPQSQGVIERFHQTLKTIIRTYCVEHQKDWDEQLPLLLLRFGTQCKSPWGSVQLN